ncbi:C45 family autoproteolytic acyltransferase/hydolase [Sporosarcina cascadiensis]|uniref:C45 family autoproteolytic acyltransferase/hydolase n=1 Tax=Sporosarcina cascadiensis TaxID=2660747 RepID=UPI00129BE7E6|nr:C45 family peptidase [Sporosarcina cascadiensis]
MDSYEELAVRVVELSGTYYQMGVQQSREFSSFNHLWKNRFQSRMNEQADVQCAEELVGKIAPSILHELHGLATGLELPAEEVIRLYSGYNIDFPEMGCTSFVCDGHYVRNYDFSPALYDARLVFTNPKTGYASVGFSQQVIGRLDGMNEKGLVAGLHFVSAEHKQPGFIATTIVRMLLEKCATIEEAIKLLAEIPHGYCYNYSLTDRSRKSVMIEAAPDSQVVNNTNPLICTNHFESETLKTKNRENIQNSIQRKNFISSLQGEELTPSSLYSQFNDGGSPLFFKQYKEYFGTLHTVVYSPADLLLMVGIGENCVPEKWSLQEFLEGTLLLPESIKGQIRHKT